jgi:hypothetical protein
VNLMISIGFIFRKEKNFYQSGGFLIFQRIGKYKVMILDDAKYAEKVLQRMSKIKWNIVGLDERGILVKATPFFISYC